MRGRAVACELLADLPWEPVRLELPFVGGGSPEPLALSSRDDARDGRFIFWGFEAFDFFLGDSGGASLVDGVGDTVGGDGGSSFTLK